MVGMFILLVGMLGVVSIFSVGMQSRLMAQELIVSQELANMWAEWVRFRINEQPSAGAPQNRIGLADLQAGKRGDFYRDQGDFHSMPGSPENPPTFNCGVYQGYTWEITAADPNYVPQWLTDDGSRAVDWDKRLDGGSAIPAALGTAPRRPVEIELTVVRGSRCYRFKYIFSGVGLKYGDL